MIMWENLQQNTKWGKNAKDEQWKIRRKQLNPAFSHNTLVSFFEIFNRLANDLKLKITEDLLGYKVKFRSLEDLITRAVLEVSCLTTMGFATNFLQNDEKCIAQSYRYLMELTALRILKPWYQIDFIFRLLDYNNYEKSKKANKLVREFVANIVQQKHIEWQHTHLHQKPDIITTTSDGAIATNSGKYEIPLNKEQEQDSDANVFMQQQQQHRIFIDQIFSLAQTGKLTLQDIMNESQSMVVVSFETVSSCIINALLCLAINHECQMKLRHEIKQVQLLLSKDKANNNNNKKQNYDTSTRVPMTTANDSKTCANTIDGDMNFDTTDCEGDVNNVSGYNDSHDGANENENVNDCNVRVTIEHLLNMPYLDMIINESLRLLTTVPMNLRNVSADFQLNVTQRDKCTCCCTTNNNSNNKNTYCECRRSSSRRSVVVPKDTMIALDIFNMQRNEMYWGENALKFYPEYFAKKLHKHQQQQNEGKAEDEHITSSTKSATASASSRHPYAFIPFSKGLRTCIGYRYSIYLSKIVLINLISSFEFSTNIQLQDLQYYEGVSLKFRNAEKIYFQIHPVG